ncbi:MAG: tetratricopeptide repeat protein [Dinoroseobacter sp.]|nr:tetratricopeptide repeat protein [Dinoroseobacter sp.]MDJ0992253.1 tetratricopeptide repeat protein [Dinoroseobacter sp.]
MLLKIIQRLNAVFAASLIVTSGAFAQGADIDELLSRLKDPETSNWEAVEQRVYDAWSQSGSPAMDLLLTRGRDALEAQDYEGAIEHFTALTDHAPEFAEGWNARATAYYLADMYGPSIQDIRVTLSLNPNHFGALAGLGLMMGELGYSEFALEAYRQAQAIHPHRPNINDAIEQLEQELEGEAL